MAATKEALALILDVGPNMVASSCLEECLQVINMILQRKLFSESKDEVMLILCGTPTSSNDLHEGDQYAHIFVEKALAPVTFELIDFIQTFSADIKGVPADFVDALVVAMDELKKSTEGKKAFGSKRIVLLSNLRESFMADQLEDIIAAMKECSYEFNYIGPCLDDDAKSEENQVSLTTNGEVKVVNERVHSREAAEVLRKILEETSGECFSLRELLPCLSFIQSRSIKSTAWKASLKIGTSLDIPINLYIKVKETKSKAFRNVCSARVDADIERSRSFHLMDDDQTEIDKSDVIEGHRYGTTLVPFSADDKEAMKVKSEKCFKVLGFTKSDNVKRHQYMGDTVWVCIAEKNNEAAQILLSALINALYETNMVAIVRRVYMNGGTVKIGCLFPHIKSKYECLFYAELPFAEDLHQSAFKSLPLSDPSKKNAPSDEQLEAVDQLISAMDLSGAKKEEEDDSSNELFKPKLLFNPYLQYLYQCVENRALHPVDQLPKLNSVVSSSLRPSQDLLDASKQVVGKLQQLFAVKLVEDGRRSMPEMISNSLPDAGVKEEREEGGGGGVRGNPVEAPQDDFSALISQNKGNIQEACIQVYKKVLELAAGEGLQQNLKVFESFAALRGESVKNKMCSHFNGLLYDLKKILRGGSRNILLSELSRRSLGVVTKTECSSSNVTVEEASGFFQSTEDEDKTEHSVACS